MVQSESNHIRYRGGGRGFTLIEIVAALLIMSLLTAAAALSFRAPLHRTAMAQGIEQIRYLDASSRRLARRFGRSVRLTIDLDKGSIERREGGNAQPTFTSQAGAPIRIAAAWTAAKQIDRREMSVLISPAGLSPTYAVKLIGPQGEQWLVISGLTGEASRFNDDARVRDIFSAAGPSRRDAD